MQDEMRRRQTGFTWMRSVRPPAASPPMAAVPRTNARRRRRWVEEKEARWWSPRPRLTEDRAVAAP